MSAYEIGLQSTGFFHFKTECLDWQATKHNHRCFVSFWCIKSTTMYGSPPSYKWPCQTQTCCAIFQTWQWRVADWYMLTLTARLWTVSKSVRACTVRRLMRCVGLWMPVRPCYLHLSSTALYVGIAWAPLIEWKALTFNKKPLVDA